jgi:acid stress-induced BolA-like protein IbaG/YrbA
MLLEDVKTLLKEVFDSADIRVEGDGHKCTMTVISNQFEGLNSVKRQQAVYQVIKPLLAEGRLHAVTIRTLTLIESQTRN